MQMKFRFAAVRCFFCQGVFFLSLSLSFSLSSLRHTFDDDKIDFSFSFSLFFFLLWIPRRTGWWIDQLDIELVFFHWFDRFFFSFSFFVVTIAWLMNLIVCMYTRHFLCPHHDRQLTIDWKENSKKKTEEEELLNIKQMVRSVGHPNINI